MLSGYYGSQDAIKVLVAIVVVGSGILTVRAAPGVLQNDVRAPNPHGSREPHGM